MRYNSFLFHFSDTVGVEEEEEDEKKEKEKEKEEEEEEIFPTALHTYSANF